MKHQTLRIAATLLTILAWVMGAIGAVVSVLVGIGAATAVAKIGFVLGGFIISAVSVIMMLAVSKLIYLFIDIEEDLAKIARSADGK
ncbi:MAG: hypothetical protein C4542_01605 [Dehalococcoidia bacterium]|nr:MAG: hypothetical protein C4542_01605 [Dehalococcoidia bacterium]